MLQTIIFMARASIGGAVTPSVSNATVATLATGTCFAGTLESPAQLTVAWNIANPHDALYGLRLYENDILVAELASSTASYEKVIDGNVEDGPALAWTSNWLYRVDVVRLSDGVVVGSAQTAVWAQDYGVCS